MGRVRKAISTLISKAEDFFTEKEKLNLLTDSLVSIDTFKFEMTPGKKLTQEEIFQENKEIILALDPKLVFLIELIKEIKGEDPLPQITQDPVYMQHWLAHIAYRNKIDNFNFLISGKSNNTLDPNVLVKSKHRKQVVRKSIKCLTDLPLQKSLLN